MKLTQPIKWHGGKHYLADWIISLMPPRETWHLYREPFAGGLSVLLRLDPQGLSEAVNDRHQRLIRFWQTLRCPSDCSARSRSRINVRCQVSDVYTTILMTEAEIEKQFVEYAEAFGCRALKLRIDGRDGFPDRTVLTPGGRVYFVEFKRPGGKLRPAQRAWIKTLRQLGFTAEVEGNAKLAGARLVSFLDDAGEI